MRSFCDALIVIVNNRSKHDNQHETGEVCKHTSQHRFLSKPRVSNDRRLMVRKQIYVREFHSASGSDAAMNSQVVLFLVIVIKFEGKS